MNSIFNPMNFLQNMIQNNGNFMNQNVPINPQQFKQFIPNITDANLEQLINQARQQGISEQDIQQGLQFIKTIK